MADFTPTQGRYLAFIRAYTDLHGYPPAESEIAAAICISPPSVNQMVKVLEKRGLISRSREIKDRRTVTARITPAGLKLLGSLDEPVQTTHRKQLGHLGRNRLRALTELLHVSRAKVG